jgi:hypothetical protein
MAEPVSRRAFLTKASVGVAGGVAAGVAATSGLSLGALLAPAAASVAPATKAKPDLTPLGQDIVAHVVDASSGDVALLIGGREILHHDPELVGRMLSGVRRATTEG